MNRLSDSVDGGVGAFSVTPFRFFRSLRNPLDDSAILAVFGRSTAFLLVSSSALISIVFSLLAASGVLDMMVSIARSKNKPLLVYRFFAGSNQTQACGMIFTTPSVLQPGDEENNVSMMTTDNISIRSKRRRDGHACVGVGEMMRRTHVYWCGTSFVKPVGDQDAWTTSKTVESYSLGCSLPKSSRPFASACVYVELGLTIMAPSNKRSMGMKRRKSQDPSTRLVESCRKW